MTTYLVTGGTGFLGRNLLVRLLQRPDAEIAVLVRKAPCRGSRRWPRSSTAVSGLRPVVGDLSRRTGWG